MSGVRIRAALSPSCCMMRVPPNRMCALSRWTDSRSLRSGTDVQLSIFDLAFAVLCVPWRYSILWLYSNAVMACVTSPSCQCRLLSRLIGRGAERVLPLRGRLACGKWTSTGLSAIPAGFCVLGATAGSRQQAGTSPGLSAGFPPVSTASSTMAVPASSSTSAGTTCSAWLSPAAPEMRRLPWLCRGAMPPHCSGKTACLPCDLERRV